MLMKKVYTDTGTKFEKTTHYLEVQRLKSFYCFIYKLETLFENIDTHILKYFGNNLYPTFKSVEFTQSCVNFPMEYMLKFYSLHLFRNNNANFKACPRK